MSLRSPIFWLIFAVFFAIYQSERLQASRKAWLWMLLASLGFVASQDLWTLVNLFGLALVCFVAAQGIASAANATARQAWLIAAVLANLAVLTHSKLHSGWAIFGVSFFVFQLISYVVDVARGRYPAEKQFLPYLTSISCFLYLTAGPILRTEDFRKQVESPGVLTHADSVEAIFRIANGLAKKSIGDLLTLPVNAYFADPGSQGLLSAWTGVLALAGQYYADFSGYSDIAIGLGSLLGLRLPENFRTPYFSPSIIDHWKRSHITLAAWASDYIFTPLCLRSWPAALGRVPGQTFVQIGFSVLITFGFIGVWHKLTWNGLLWGFYNGGLIILTYLFPRLPDVRLPGKQVLKILFTFYLILMGRVFLRTEQPSEIWMVWKELHQVHSLGPVVDASLLTFALVVAGLVGPHLLDALYLSKTERFRKGPLAWVLALALLFFWLVFNTPGRPFLYENF